MPPEEKAHYVPVQRPFKVTPVGKSIAQETVQPSVTAKAKSLSSSLFYQGCHKGPLFRTASEISNLGISPHSTGVTVMRALICLVVCLMLVAGNASAQNPPEPSVPTDDEIRNILTQRIDVQKQSIGIVVGIIEPNQRRIISYGSLDKNDKRPLDGDTLFEIGSITKVFTALLLTDMVGRGEVKLDDPVAKYLPQDVKIPEWNGKAITLADLATHTSGLPRMPANFRPKDPANPYADYTVDQLYQFLSSYELTRDIGTKFVYSNLGFGLLGQALAHRAGTDYEALVESRICAPLGMKSTRITLSPEMRARLAVGHSEDLVAVPNWDLPTLAGAGALRSSANDLLTFLAPNLGYVETSLSPAMKAMLSVQRPTGAPFLESALGWAIDTRSGNEIIWKNGGTGGYRTFIGYSPKTRTGIVALSNSGATEGVDDIGLHLFDARYPLFVPEGSAKEANIDTKLFDRYIGHYELTPNFILAITRDGEQLFTQATGQTRVALYPKTDREFFLKVVDAQITFETDATGQSTGLILHQNGKDQSAKRISDEEAAHLEDAVAKRFKDQTAMPGSEDALRRTLDEIRQGRPNYDQMSTTLADATRQQLPQIQAKLASLGPLQSVSFKGVGPGGADIYQLKFDNGSAEWRILLAPDGKIALLFYRPLP